MTALCCTLSYARQIHLRNEARDAPTRHILYYTPQHMDELGALMEFPKS